LLLPVSAKRTSESPENRKPVPERAIGRRAGNAGGKTPAATKPTVSPNTADDGNAAGASPLASTGAGTGPAIAAAGLLATAGASLLATVAHTRRRDAGHERATDD